MRERFEELALLESIDAGKPLAATRRMDMPAAIDCLEYYAGWADKITGEVVPTRLDALTYVHRVPVGCRRRHRAVEFSADERGVEDRAGVGLRLHGGAQARGAHAAVGVVARPRRTGGRPAARRAQRHSRLRRGGRRGARRACRASTRSPSPDRRGPGSSSCARPPSISPESVSSSAASRERRVRRRRHRCGRSPDRLGRLLQCRPGLLGCDAGNRRGSRARCFRRTSSRSAPRACASATRWRPAPRSGRSSPGTRWTACSDMSTSDAAKARASCAEAHAPETAVSSWSRPCSPA